MMGILFIYSTIKVLHNANHEETETYQGKDYDVYISNFTFGISGYPWDYDFIDQIHVEFSC